SWHPPLVHRSGEGAARQQPHRFRLLVHQLEKRVRNFFAQLGAIVLAEPGMAGEVGEEQIALEVRRGALASDLGAFLHREAVKARTAPEQRIDAPCKIGLQAREVLFLNPVLKRIHLIPLYRVPTTSGCAGGSPAAMQTCIQTQVYS